MYTYIYIYIERERSSKFHFRVEAYTRFGSLDSADTLADREASERASSHLSRDPFYYAMLCYAMLCYAMLCYAMLCYAML